MFQIMLPRLSQTLMSLRINLALGLGLMVVITLPAQANTQTTKNTAQSATVLQNEVTSLSDEQKLHSSLIITALQLDFANARCRGISLAKNFSKVNRLFITKYSLTANNYIKLYINNDVRQEKTRQETRFKKTLNQLGGCAKAKQQDWIKNRHDFFRTLYSQVEKSIWFPEQN